VPNYFVVVVVIVESRAIAVKKAQCRIAAANFVTYRNVYLHRAVLPAIGRLFCLQCLLQFLSLINIKDGGSKKERRWTELEIFRISWYYCSVRLS